MICRAQIKAAKILRDAPQSFGPVEHSGQMVMDLLFSAAGQKPYKGASGVKPVTTGKLIASGSHANRFHERMPYILDSDAFASIEIFFKRKYHQHSVNVPTNSIHAISAPGPNLRAYIIDYLEPIPAQPARKPHIEIRPIYQHYSMRPSLARRFDKGAVGAIKPPERSGYFGNANYRYVASIDQRLHSCRAHFVAARAEHFKLSIG